jgi:transketolase
MANKDIRDAFFDELYSKAVSDESIVIITNDMDVFSLRKFKEEFPERFINIGVAEQNMISVAAGLASCGKKVFIYGISAFVTLRCYEQIKFSICSMNLPVVIVGMGVGLSFSFDGPTHQGMHDMAAMRVLPEMQILNPSDSTSAAHCFHVSYESRCPTYVRLDKGVLPYLYQKIQGLGRKGMSLWYNNSDVALVCTGSIAYQCINIADKLCCKAIDVYRIKPFDEETFLDLIQDCKTIICIEESSPIGGLCSIVSDIIARESLPARFLPIALDDKQYFDYGERDWLYRQYGLDSDSIKSRILQFIG